MNQDQSKLAEQRREQEKNTNYYMCDCHTEILVLDNDEEFVYMSIYQHGKHQDNRLSLTDRIRFAWNALITGRPYSDSIVLDYGKAKEIGEKLTKITG